jgi:hypothetical protein
MTIATFTPEQLDQLATETWLCSLGDVIPLNLKINLHQFDQEIAAFNDKWVPYLHKTDRSNDRQGLCLYGLPDGTMSDGLSMPESIRKAKRVLHEMEFNTPTEVFNHCQSLHEVFRHFSPVGRSFLVKCNAGGWFFPHRDDPQLWRKSMRLIAFLRNSKEHEYDFILDDRKIHIEEGRLYYINTRKMHRTMSYVNDSIHLIMNIHTNTTMMRRMMPILQHGWVNISTNIK